MSAIVDELVSVFPISFLVHIIDPCIKILERVVETAQRVGEDFFEFFLVVSESIVVEGDGPEEVWVVVEVVKSFLVVDDEDVSPVDGDEVFVFSDIEQLFVEDFLVQFFLAFFLFQIELVWVEWVEQVGASLFVGFELFHELGILLVTEFDDTFEVIAEVVERVWGFGTDLVGIDEDAVVVVTDVL